METIQKPQYLKNNSDRELKSVDNMIELYNYTQTCIRFVKQAGNKIREDL